MLPDQGRTRHTLHRSLSLGFAERGRSRRPGAVVVDLPDDLQGAELSVCGLKGFLIDEERCFRADDGSQITVACAKVAALDIVDSPVHVHGETLESYQILAGQGRMVLGEEVVAVQPGSFVLIPPGTEHGLASDNPERPLRVLMTFTPGLAPVSAAEWRDERICYERASERIAHLSG